MKRFFKPTWKQKEENKNDEMLNHSIQSIPKQVVQSEELYKTMEWQGWVALLVFLFVLRNCSVTFWMILTLNGGIYISKVTSAMLHSPNSLIGVQKFHLCWKRQLRCGQSREKKPPRLQMWKGGEKSESELAMKKDDTNDQGKVVTREAQRKFSECEGNGSVKTE